MVMRGSEGTGQRATDTPLPRLEEDAAFRIAVRKGVEQADRREFVPDEEMNERLRRMLGL